MEDPNHQPGHLKTRTVIIVFAGVAVVFMGVCLSVGAWPLALGVPVAILMIPLMNLVLNLLGRLIIGLPLAILERILPKHVTTAAKEKQQLHPAVVVLIFFAFVGILLLIFRDIGGVIAGLMIAGLLLGLPMLAEWSRKRKIKTAANNTSEGIRRPADGSPKPSV